MPTKTISAFALCHIFFVFCGIFNTCTVDLAPSVYLIPLEIGFTLASFVCWYLESIGLSWTVTGTLGYLFPPEVTVRALTSLLIICLSGFFLWCLSAINLTSLSFPIPKIMLIALTWVIEIFDICYCIGDTITLSLASWISILIHHKCWLFISAITLLRIFVTLIIKRDKRRAIYDANSFSISFVSQNTVAYPRIRIILFIDGWALTSVLFPNQTWLAIAVSILARVCLLRIDKIWALKITSFCTSIPSVGIFASTCICLCIISESILNLLTFSHTFPIHLIEYKSCQAFTIITTRFALEMRDTPITISRTRTSLSELSIRTFHKQLNFPQAFPLVIK